MEKEAIVCIYGYHGVICIDINKIIKDQIQNKKSIKINKSY